MDFEQRKINFNLTESDIDEINYFLSNTDEKFLNETEDKFEITRMFRGILKVANAKIKKWKLAIENELEAKQKHIEQIVSNVEQTGKDFEKLQSDYNLLQNRYDNQVNTTELKEKLISELNQKISDLQTENKRLESVWTNAQKEIQRLTNEIKDNELAPNEFIIALSNSQRRCIIYETRQKHFVEKIAQLAKDKGTQVKAVTNDDNENIANFLWNYFYYSKKFSSGVLPIDELINAHNKYDK